MHRLLIFCFWLCIVWNESIFHNKIASRKAVWILGFIKKTPLSPTLGGSDFNGVFRCLWATKKIFLLFLRMNSNPHHNYPVRKKPYFTRFFYCQSWTGGFRFPCFFFCVWEQGVLNSNQSWSFKFSGWWATVSRSVAAPLWDRLQKSP